jgi:hypothetical protein
MAIDEPELQRQIDLEADARNGAFEAFRQFDLLVAGDSDLLVQADHDISDFHTGIKAQLDALAGRKARLPLELYHQSPSLSSQANDARDDISALMVCARESFSRGRPLDAKQLDTCALESGTLRKRDNGA